MCTLQHVKPLLHSDWTQLLCALYYVYALLTGHSCCVLSPRNACLAYALLTGYSRCKLVPRRDAQHGATEGVCDVFSRHAT